MDGEPAPITRVDGALRGIAVPKGQHIVVFRYRPPALFVGGMVTTIFWAGLMIAGVWRWVRRRRGMAPAYAHSM